MEPHGSNPLLWSQSHYHSDLDVGNDDFSSFLNLTDINLDIPQFDGGHSGLETGKETHGGHAQGEGGMEVDYGHHGGMGEQTMTDVSDMEFAQLEHSVANLAGQGMVPHTPTSMEMRGHEKYAQQQQQRQGGYGYHADDQMIFTPLISPAVTPLEPSFATVPDFSMPGSYFSPLTSPMLEAQYHNVPKYSSMGGHTSPIDPTDSPNLARGTKSARRKSIVRPATTSGRVVKESPIIKPQNKKKSAEMVNQLAQLTTTTSSPHISIPAGSATSTPMKSSAPPLLPKAMQLPQAMDFSRESSDSISPEPLSEMPPPPPPSKSRRSSMIARPEKSGGSSMPATPASLMRLANAEDALNTTAFSNLPNPALPISSASATVIGPRSSSRSGRHSTTASPALRPDETTPTLRARGTPNLAPKLTPKLVPALPSSTALSTRKRPSSSIESSPALLPRLSPALHPSSSPALPPSSSTSTALATSLLASKSNYQNILEGNSSSLGLSYPEELGTHLTSKRTSHKLAEQGRRDRINSAISELGGLLPEEFGGREKGLSKAGVVEWGIRYIRRLREEVEGLRRENGVLKGEGGKESEMVVDEGEDKRERETTPTPSNSKPGTPAPTTGGSPNEAGPPTTLPA